MRYTAEILPYHDYPLEVAIRELAGLGFTEVNLWSSAAPLAHHVTPGDDPSAIRAVLDRYGMRPCGLTMYGKTQDEMLERIEFARDLGIDTVIFDCEANYPDFVAKFLPALVEAAARNGVRIAVENHLTVPFNADFESGHGEEQRWDEGVDTLAQIKRLVRDIDHPNLGICLAPPQRQPQRGGHPPSYQPGPSTHPPLTYTGNLLLRPCSQALPQGTHAPNCQGCLILREHLVARREQPRGPGGHLLCSPREAPGGRSTAWRAEQDGAFTIPGPG